MRGDRPGLSRPERISFGDMDLDLPNSASPAPRVPAALNRTATPISEPALSFGELSMSFGCSEVPLRPELANCLGDALRDVGEYYDIIGPLGRGRYSRVFQCVRKADGVEFAVKRISKRCDWELADAQRLRDEIATLRRLKHAHICRLVDVFESERDVHAVLELCNGGELFEYIVERGHLDAYCARQITRQMCEAVEYVHSMDVTHRDLKPENVLLVTRGLCEASETLAPLSVKIIDFGLSAWGGAGGAVAGDAPPSDGVAFSAATVTRTDSLNSVVGTAGYMAPEIGHGGTYTRAVDAWSVGVVLYTMLCGCR
jgi:serine/threonine protein kinase